MYKNQELSQKEIALLKKVNIEISLGFAHILNLEKSISMKDIQEIKISRSPETIFQKIIRSFNSYLSQDSRHFNGIRPDNYRLITIYLYNKEEINYELKNIDLISTSKLFNKLFDSTHITNTSINEKTQNKFKKNN
jgi:hypothetical protein